IRRSPGGSTPNSWRSRPDDPPLSATVTIAVTSSVTRRRADKDAARPCPPPNATTLMVKSGSLPPEVAMGDGELAARHPGLELVGDGGGPVLAAGAADGQRHVALALAFEPGQRHVEHREVRGDERGRRGLAEHVVAHGGVEAAQRAQLGYPVRVGQEPAVG